AVEYTVRHQPIRRALSLDLLRRFAEGERLSLREDIRQQHVVVPPESIQWAPEGDEVTRNESRPLMDQLIEGVLAIGARLSPIDGAGVAGNGRSIQPDVLAIALHRQLLQIGGESLQVLLVR